MSVSATFDNVSGFANKELGSRFPKEFTDAVMTPEFQAFYADESMKAYKARAIASPTSKDHRAFEKYLSTTSLTENEKTLLLQRMEMQQVIGNNQEYVGNGVTKNTIANSGNQFGAVETLNFERKEVSIKELHDKKVIHVINL